jgi:hypothetical protein
LADALRHLPDEPDSLRLQFLVRREVAFDENLECVSDSLRIFIAERADAPLQLGKRGKIIVQAAPYQQSRVGVFRGHLVCTICRQLPRHPAMAIAADQKTFAYDDRGGGPQSGL